MGDGPAEGGQPEPQRDAKDLHADRMPPPDPVRRASALTPRRLPGPVAASAGRSPAGVIPGARPRMAPMATAQRGTDRGSRRRGHLVVIGSSAGGHRGAVHSVVADLPADPGARSSSPSTSTRAGRATCAEILARHAGLPIDVVDGAAELDRRRDLRGPGQPAGRGHRWRRAAAPGRGVARSRHRSISCFSSAAEAYGERLIAVILTGTGSDGIGRGVGRQASRRHGRHREPGDRHVPVDARLRVAVDSVDARAELGAIGGVVRRPVEAGPTAAATR